LKACIYAILNPQLNFHDIQGVSIVEQLIQTVAQKANISPEIARVAVETVLNLLKAKLPAPIASQLDGLLNGTVSTEEIAKDSAGGLLGGILGKQ
jgi:hypothetical protein